MLFRYAEHVASGEGITFNLGGPRVEGATDFLWMLMLAAGVRLGADVAMVAVFLNALGSGLLAGTLVHLFRGRRALQIWDGAVACAIAVSTPFLAGAHASCDGFSTELYSGLIVAGYALCVGRRLEGLLVIPYLALVLGLFRPEGVILGATQVLVAFVRKRRHPQILRRLAFHTGWAALLGGLYFIWRFRYFGELLPLPLLVKSHGATLSQGWAFNRTWLLESSGVLAVLGAVALFAILQRRRGHFPHRVLLIVGAVSPGLMLFLALLFAYQSQNVDHRFQAPIFSLVEAALFALSCEFLSRAGTSTPTALALRGGAVLALLPALAHGKQVWPLDYMDTTAAALGPKLDSTTIVLTEAGRLPYWTRARVIDVVGLNDPRSAKEPVDSPYIESFEPGLIMFHTSSVLDEARLLSFVEGPTEREVVRVRAAALRASLTDAYRRVASNPPDTFPPGSIPHRIAAAVLSNYIGTSDSFDVFLVRYGRGFRHVWAISRHAPFASTVQDALQASATQPYESYARVKRLEWGSTACRVFSALAAKVRPETLGWPGLPRCSTV